MIPTLFYSPKRTFRMDGWMGNLKQSRFKSHFSYVRTMGG